MFHTEDSVDQRSDWHFVRSYHDPSVPKHLKVKGANLISAIALNLGCIVWKRLIDRIVFHTDFILFQVYHSKNS